MPVFPGDPEVTFERVHAISQGGYNVTRVTVGSHSGTHVDVPSHVMFSDHTADTIPLDTLVGWAEVVDLGELARGAEITSAHLDVFSDRIDEGARILLRTGWSKQYGSAGFFDGFPGLSEGAAVWLGSRKTRLLGLEQPSVHPSDHLEVHKLLLAAGVVVVESMDLREITAERVYLAVLPLKLAGLDGAPARAIALENGEA